MSTAQMEKVFRQVRNVIVGESGGMTDGQLLETFLATNDHFAFEALVHRHGPMVLAVCRRVLKNRHDAEDAFQATFLVLVRKASSIRNRELLANWLYGVAHRTAMKANTMNARRRSKESRAEAPPQTESTIPDDLLARLDDELARLPEKYRAPVVLCDLEGLSRPDAARKLGWPVGTVNWRLAKARTMLAKRLSRKGLSLPVAAIAAAIADKSASASVPSALIAETVKASAAIASGADGGLISTSVLALAEGVVKTMLVEKLKIGTVILLAFLLVGTGAFFASQSSPAATEPGNDEPEEGLAAQAPKNDDPASMPSISNFRVEAPTPEIANKIGLAAERYRKEKALEWLGRELPAWPERCLIRVKLTVSGSGGATAFAFDNGKVVQQSMTLEGSLDHILKVDLPHEMTHVILAHHFRRPIPRWADEGAAVLSSAELERRHYEEQLKKVLSEPNRLVPLRRLFTFTDYPSDVMALYAEGFSVTRFLVETKDRGTFLKFLAAGKKDGWDAAVERHYGYASVDAMERAWFASLALRGPTDAKESSPLLSKTYPVADLVEKGAEGDKLITSIKETIDPKSWADNGGRGTIDMFPLGMSLVITQTENGHQQIRQLLASLRGRNEQKKLKGTWRSFACEVAGKRVPKEEAGTYEFVFGDGELTIRTIRSGGKDESVSYRCDLDSIHEPKAMDLNILGKTQRGIYEFHGSVLKLCLGEAGEARPIRFATSENNNYRLIALRRQDAVRKPDEWAEKMFTSKEGLGALAHDFGHVMLARHRFTMHNIWATPVEIISVGTSMSGLTAKPSTTVLKPGESGYIEVTVDAARFTGSKTGNVFITAQSPNGTSTAILQVSATRYEEKGENEAWTVLERRLQLAFGNENEEVAQASIKFNLRSQHLVLAAKSCDILDKGRMKLSGCWYASFDKERITAIRCDEAIISFDGPIAEVSELSRRKILAIEPSGKVRITFHAADSDTDSTTPNPVPALPAGRISR